MILSPLVLSITITAVTGSDRLRSHYSKLINVLQIISFENSLFVFDLCYNRIRILTKVMISHAKTPSV